MANISSQGGEGPVSSVLAWYNYLMVDLRDPRADSLPLMSSIWPTTIICILYVFFCKVAGPWFMKNREPYNIKGFIIAYNMFQTLFSLWGFVQGWRFYVSGNYSWICQPVDYSNDPEALRALNLAWLFYMAKFLDMFDSFFFVLKKKFSHLSFLHVYHHAMMPWWCWFGPRFVGGGNSGLVGFVNALVHTVMYLYYLLAACGPRIQKYLWWKRYLTKLQMGQFVLVFCHQLVYSHVDCGFPKICIVLMAFHAFIFFVLFANFYFFAYINQKKKD